MDVPSASALLERLEVRELSSRELLEDLLARIEKRGPELNAVVTVDAERARARADAADAARARGERWGPLHGLPMTVKDTFETEGLRTTAGFEPLRDHVPARDAAAVARLKRAGAIVFGKTNSPELAADWQSYNSVFGTTRNPWDVARTPGGSSGGAAAALAAGFTPLELGSDIGGSIRIPAAWCGVFGHKPSHGIVPQRGHIPGPPGALAEPDLAVAGPMARSVADLERALPLLAGPLEEEGRAWRFSLPAPRHERWRDYRVAVWLDTPELALDSEVRARLEQAVAALRRAGVAVDEAARPAFTFAESLDAYMRLVSPIFLAGLPPEQFAGMVETAARLESDPSYTARFARYGTERHRDWLAANEARQRLRARWTGFFRETDLLLCPVAGVPAIPHDHGPFQQRTIEVNGEPRPYHELFGWIHLATVSLLPATSAPVGRTRQGLPVGLQIVGPRHGDLDTLRFAAGVEEVMGGFEPPPGWGG